MCRCRVWIEWSYGPTAAVGRLAWNAEYRVTFAGSVLSCGTEAGQCTFACVVRCVCVVVAERVLCFAACKDSVTPCCCSYGVWEWRYGESNGW